MHISAMEEYGLRCALQLARSAHSQAPLSASEISEKERISVEYVSKFMHLFKKAGIVKAVRGVQGGFQLVNGPEAVNLKQVFDALKPQPQPLSTSFCDHYAGKADQCVHRGGCSVRPFWEVLSEHFEEVTRNLTLADLMLREEASRAQVLRKVYNNAI
jgi:Rrf2 family protein